MSSILDKIEDKTALVSIKSIIISKSQILIPHFLIPNRHGETCQSRASLLRAVPVEKMFVRFDVPVIGVETTRLVAEVNLRVIVIEAGRTLPLEAMRLSILPMVEISIVVR